MQILENALKLCKLWKLWIGGLIIQFSILQYDLVLEMKEGIQIQHIYLLSLFFKSIFHQIKSTNRAGSN